MKKKTFSRAERYAVWTAHGERCWLCRKPMNYAEMHIDHIIPEALVGTEELKSVLETFKLPPDFDLNSWSNWMPAHGPCNVDKKEHVFEPAPIILKYIAAARVKSNEVQRLHDRFLANRKLDVAFAQVIQAYEDKNLSSDQLMELAKVAAHEHTPNRAADMKDQPVLLAPGITVLRENTDQFILQGPSGMVGVRPKGDRLHSSWDCPSCGVTGWSGARCIRCGQFSDD
ncbi:HNH endonuclease [Rhizobium daejeonense]|uniref:HNH endonuclease n=1 Tax=Rhizobium daejeonense TaxID=240521 RepID=A0A6M1S6Z6_9HYPH|nr:HNH endonuclease signature motif containing protein [Rhizobium daejeonense]NGO62476.1 HNH endonuclease [Rhizobium daejeonense]